MIHPDTLEQRNKDEQCPIGGDGSINGSQPSERCKRKNNRPRATRWTTVYRRALAAAPSAFVYTNPGNIYKSQQQPTEAERCFRQALATDADFYPAHYDRRIGSDVVPPTGTFRCRTVPSY